MESMVRCILCDEWDTLESKGVVRYTSRDEKQILTFYISFRRETRHIQTFGAPEILVPINNFEDLLTFRMNG